VVYAGATAPSFAQAARDLAEEAELSVSSARVRRATERIGRARSSARRRGVERWRQLPLPAQRRSPHDHIPAVACVQVDGGRVQIRERCAARAEPPSSGFWRESKVACLLRMQSRTSTADPCPQLPESFANLARMAELTREIKGSASVVLEPEGKPAEREPPRPQRPQVVTRHVIAVRSGVEEFGQDVAAAAWEAGFVEAPRKAFVADGQAANWTLWRKHFSDYVPVLDFVHAICYVFKAAAAGRRLDDLATVYRRWAQWAWEGDLERLLEGLRERQAELGEPEPDDAETHPRQLLAEALQYLENQRSRMHYPEYRRQGLPITSAYVESTIKQLNRRVKGSEKFWSEAGAEALLQLAADYLSDRAPLDRFWRQRPEQCNGTRCYR
jgi:hypothetical protein